MSDAYEQGRRAGRMTLAPGLNPFADSSAEAADWLLGWQASAAEAARYANAKIQRDRLHPRWEDDSSLERDARLAMFGRIAA